MLTIEIKVNGNIVAVIAAHNASYGKFSAAEPCDYHAQGFEFGYSDQIKRDWESKVKHAPKAGILALAAALLKDAAGAK